MEENKERARYNIGPEEAEFVPAISEPAKKKIFYGSIIGGVVFIALLIGILIIALTSSRDSPKPDPAPTPYSYNPFCLEHISHDSSKVTKVTLFNNRSAFDKSPALRSGVIVKNTTENEEAERILVIFEHMDEHLLRIQYVDPKWDRWIVPQYGRDTDPYREVSERITTFPDINILKKANNIFEWSFFGKQKGSSPIISTESCNLLYFDKYLEFEARVQTNSIYGMGERSTNFSLTSGNYSLWNSDSSNEFETAKAIGTYGSHPFFLNRLKNSSNFLGLFMRNSNAMLFSFWEGSEGSTIINYKMIGGIIDMYLFHVADADYILKKYHTLIGRPYLPPVWGMGLQQGRRGYTLEKIKEVVLKYSTNFLPLDSIWADIDLNEKFKTFTVDGIKFKGVKEFVKSLHNSSINFVAIANPGIKKEEGYKIYDDAMQKNCVIKSAAFIDQSFEGRTIAGTTVWLDFFLYNSVKIWAEGLHTLRDLVDFDGIWISDNEISHLCDGECRGRSSISESIPNPFHNASEFSYLPYRPTKENLEKNSLPLAAYHCCDDIFYKQFYTHNLYGLQVTKATNDVLLSIFEEKRYLVASRSTWAGSGHYGSHWLGDNYATWESLRGSISGILNFNLFGIPHVGAAIGGVKGVVEPELLIRWYELGCYSPLMLSYTQTDGNNIEPYSIEENVQYIRHALLERYALIRFMYTKMFESFAWGGAVVHPLFFEFPDDPIVYTSDIIHTTFMWGKTLYVIPALVKGERSSKVYLPNWRWYDLRSWALIVDHQEKQKGEYITFQQPLGYATVLVKGGTIIPYQITSKEKRVLNVEDLKNIPIQIIVAPDHFGKAIGSMIVDSEGIRPHPNPMSNSYRHYSFTYMNNIFRINKLAGFDFHDINEHDYFWQLVILDVFGRTNIEFVCMMDQDFYKKELEFWHAMDTEALIIHAKSARMPMFMLESIVWGTVENYNFCKFQAHVETIDYPDEKSLLSELATNDPASSQIKFELRAMILTDRILSMSLSKIEHGKYSWVVPYVIDEDVRRTSKATKSIEESGFRISAPYEPFFFEIIQTEEDFNFIITSRNLQFVYVHDFIHLKLLVNSKHIFGLGERVNKFELGDGLYSLFNYDQSREETGVAPGNNMYGSHAFYLMHLHNPKDFAGFFLLNSNPIDVKIRHVGMHTEIDHLMIGGIVDAFFINKGSAEEIIQSYQYLIGKPEPLPYWAFGYHHSRWGYRDIQHLKDVITKFELFGIPYDAIWMDKDYTDGYKTFTINANKWSTLPQFVKELQNKGKHIVAIVDAGIANNSDYKTYKQGLERGVFMESADTKQPLIGVTWPGYSVWIDFLHPAADSFWESELYDFFQKIPFDGLWLDMNEPSNFCDGECPDQTHYTNYFFPLDFYDDLYYNPTHRALETGTISLEALHYGRSIPAPEFNYHNLYGLIQSKMTAKFFYSTLRKRPFISSSSTFPGIGRYASHTLGDNFSSWHMLQYSISGIFNFQLFGIPFVGADICGYNGNATVELCSRWMQLGAFYPMMRNHNSPSSTPQEPYVDPKLASISRSAIKIRYSLARYSYSNYMKIVFEGGVLVSPVLFSFPSDQTLYSNIDETLMYGPAIHIAPVLMDRTEKTTTYFPNHDWYNFTSLEKVIAYNRTSTKGKNLVVECSLEFEKINMHIKGGSIFPNQDEAMKNNVTTITKMLDYPIKLIASLDHNLKAEGYLFYDETNETLNSSQGNFHYFLLNLDNNILKFTLRGGNRNYKYPYSDNIISLIAVLGAKSFSNTVCARVYDEVDKANHYLDAVYDANKETLLLTAQGSYQLVVPRINSISWFNTTC